MLFLLRDANNYKNKNFIWPNKIQKYRFGIYIFEKKIKV